MLRTLALRLLGRPVWNAPARLLVLRSSSLVVPSVISTTRHMLSRPAAFFQCKRFSSSSAVAAEASEPVIPKQQFPVQLLASELELDVAIMLGDKDAAKNALSHLPTTDGAFLRSFLRLTGAEQSAASAPFVLLVLILDMLHRLKRHAQLADIAKYHLRVKSCDLDSLTLVLLYLCTAGLRNSRVRSWVRFSVASISLPTDSFARRAYNLYNSVPRSVDLSAAAAAELAAHTERLTQYQRSYTAVAAPLVSAALQKLRVPTLVEKLFTTASPDSPVEVSQLTMYQDLLRQLGCGPDRYAQIKTAALELVHRIDAIESPFVSDEASKARGSEKAKKTAAPALKSDTNTKSSGTSVSASKRTSADADVRDSTTRRDTTSSLVYDVLLRELDGSANEMHMLMLRSKRLAGAPAEVRRMLTDSTLTVASVEQALAWLKQQQQGWRAYSILMRAAAGLRAPHLVLDILRATPSGLSMGALVVAISEMGTAAGKGDALAAQAAQQLFYSLQQEEGVNQLDSLAVLLLLHANAGRIRESNMVASSLLEEAEREGLLDRNEEAPAGVARIGVSNFVAALCVRALVRAGDAEQAAEAYDQLVGVGRSIPPMIALDVGLPLLALAKQRPGDRGSLLLYRAARYLLHAALSPVVVHVSESAQSSLVSALFAAGLHADARVCFARFWQLSHGRELAASALPYLSRREAVETVEALKLPQLGKLKPIVHAATGQLSYVLDTRDVLYSMIGSVVVLFLNRILCDASTRILPVVFVMQPVVEGASSPQLEGLQSTLQQLLQHANGQAVTESSTPTALAQQLQPVSCDNVAAVCLSAADLTQMRLQWSRVKEAMLA